MKNSLNYTIQFNWISFPVLLFLSIFTSFTSKANALSKKLEIKTETTKSSDYLLVDKDSSLLDLLFSQMDVQTECLESNWDKCYFDSYESYCKENYDWLNSEASKDVGLFFRELNKLLPKARSFIKLKDGQNMSDLRMSDSDAQKIVDLYHNFFDTTFEKGQWAYDNSDSVKLADRWFYDDGKVRSEFKRSDDFVPSFKKEFTEKGELEYFHWDYYSEQETDYRGVRSLEYKKIPSYDGDSKSTIRKYINLPHRVSLRYEQNEYGEEISMDWGNAFKLGLEMKDGKVSSQSLKLYESCPDVNLIIFYKYPLSGTQIYKDGVFECTNYNNKHYYDFNKLEYGTVDFNENGDTTYLDLTRHKNMNIKDDEGKIQLDIHFDCDPYVQFYYQGSPIKIRKEWSEDWDLDSGKKLFFLREETYSDADENIFKRIRYWPNGDVKSEQDY